MSQWSVDETEKLQRLVKGTHVRTVRAIAKAVEPYFDRTGQAIRRKMQTDPVIRKILEEKIYDMEIERLKDELLHERMRSKPRIYDYEGAAVRFGVLSDVHFGSDCENLGLVEAAYRQFEKEGIKEVFLPGDMLDGDHVYPGHEFEVRVVGCDAQMDHLVTNFPKVEGIKNKYIDGNHDGSFWRRAGIRTGRHMAEMRPDFEYLGFSEVDVLLENNRGRAIMRLRHPGGGTAYAISYNAQGYINSITGGHKPNIILAGHFHKEIYFMWRNIHHIDCGCTQDQTEYMKKKKTAAVQGFHIVEVVMNGEGVSRIKVEWFPCYD